MYVKSMYGDGQKEVISCFLFVIYSFTLIVFVPLFSRSWIYKNISGHVIDCVFSFSRFLCIATSPRPVSRAEQQRTNNRRLVRGLATGPPSSDPVQRGDYGRLATPYSAFNGATSTGMKSADEGAARTSSSRYIRK